MRALRWFLEFAIGLSKLLFVLYWCLRAYRIRMFAVKEYGYIIHEFDPWFNYRATEYLAEHGWHKFFRWYDMMSWYPIGRPVGTTIYPGMQIASVAIWKVLQILPRRKVDVLASMLAGFPAWALQYFPNFGQPFKIGPMSLNDVCCLVPAWFGAVATLFLYMFTVEVSGSTGAGLAAAAIFAIIPAHTMRSMAGEFDNEAVAVSIFCLVLWLWCLSIRSSRTWPFGVATGVAYAFAAATWGGYVFLNNLVALHALVLVGLGKYCSSLHKAYSLYYMIGSVGASLVPPIGWAPFRSVEQMPSLLVFLAYQFMELCDIFRRRGGNGMTAARFFLFRILLAAVALGVIASVAYIMMQLGIFMPLGARIRGLFMEAVKTGNPLVDSVAEHSPGSPAAFQQYLGEARLVAPLGLLFCWQPRSPSKFILPLYAAVAYYYSMKMIRLIIICGPIVSALAGIAIGVVGDWCLEQFIRLACGPRAPVQEERILERTGGMGSILRAAWRALGPIVYPRALHGMSAAKGKFGTRFPLIDRPLRVAFAGALAFAAWRPGRLQWGSFSYRCDYLATQIANPELVFKSKLRSGEEVLVDDYLKGYQWLRDNTPADSRVIAWWDYGYQITGVGNRTSLADGNTWNHEHIATLGRILTSPEKRAHNAIRHLADYALVWQEDMDKSPHLARIGNSVFPDHCGDRDPLCMKYGVYEDESPTPMMAKSFLYKAVNHKTKPGVQLNPSLFEEVHTSQYGLLRIFKVQNVSQESKDWVADPANRVCDAPGSWYCVGQYPPAVAPLIAKRKNFAQLEDFNKAGEKSAYTKLLEKGSGGQEL